MEKIYDNREFSWLKFNERVLDEAKSPLTPPLEKLRFISITTNNLDEFYMVRVGSLTDQMLLKPDNSDKRAEFSELYENILDRTAAFYEKQESVYKDVMAELRENHVQILKPGELSAEQLTFIKLIYVREIAPLLSAHIVDNRSRYPHLENKNVNIALHLKKKDKRLLAFVHKGRAIPRLIKLPSKSGLKFVLTDDIILRYAGRFFDGCAVLGKTLVKVTRNADLDALEALYDEDVNYRSKVKDLIKKRKRLLPVKIEVSEKISKEFRKLLANNLSDKIMLVNKIPMSFDFLSDIEKNLRREDKHKLIFPRWEPKLPKWYNEKMIDTVLKNDVFLSYPYNSTKPFFRLLEEAATNPEVSSIKVTLYRLSHYSKLIDILLKACEAGKEVVAVMELRARFDEDNNINYSEILENAGAKILYGPSEYKIHSKVLLITMGDKYITHLATGNYNENTAKLYTDLNIITANYDIGKDSENLFANIENGNLKGKYNILYVSPNGIMKKLIKLINKEIEFQKEFGNGYIIMKFNSLTSRPIMEKLIEASKAGVKIQLIVRGICCLVPGIKNETENISVISIVGRFLEHSRVFYFNHNGEKRMYISSADLMTRNLERRVETAVPILDEGIKNQIYHTLLVMLSDDVKARVMTKNRKYHKKDTQNDINSQSYFCEIAEL